MNPFEKTLDVHWLFTPHNITAYAPRKGIKKLKITGINLTVSQVNNMTVTELNNTPVKSLDAAITNNE